MFGEWVFSLLPLLLGLPPLPADTIVALNNSLLYLFWQHFATETQDLSGLEWSPDGSVLCVWDSLLEVSGNLPIS